MITLFTFPAGLEAIIESILDHHAVSYDKAEQAGATQYTLSGDYVRYGRTIEKDFTLLRIPYDKIAPGNMILHQLRIIGGRYDAIIRIAEIRNGVVQQKPSKSFRQSLTVKRGNSNQKVGAPMDSKLCDMDAASMAEQILVGSWHIDRDSLAEVVAAFIDNAGPLDQQKVETLAKFTPKVKKPLLQWLEQQAA